MNYKRINLIPLIVIATLIGLVACGGGGGEGTDGTAPTSYPPTVVDCGGAEPRGTLAATALFPNGTTPVAAATVTISNISCIIFGICFDVPICSGQTGPAGTIEFRNVSADVYDKLKMEKGMFSTFQTGVVVSAGSTASSTLALSADAKRLGVVAGRYDNIEVVLTRLGFAWETLTKANLANATVLNGYDAVFLNCGVDQVGLTPPDPDDPAAPFYFLDETWAVTVAANLQNFLTSGPIKRLYASDWAYVYVEKAFPTAIDFYSDDNSYDYVSWNQPRVGYQGSYTASVDEPGLRTALGERSTMGVVFDLPWWAAINSIPATTTPLVSADIRVGTGDTTYLDLPNRPLAASFPHGSLGGKVIFTSFHNEAQPTADMDKILEYLIAH